MINREFDYKKERESQLVLLLFLLGEKTKQKLEVQSCGRPVQFHPFVGLTTIEIINCCLELTENIGHEKRELIGYHIT